ncbi:hypothetical protein BJ170DRAFT_215460 [Xylariales sp. AK1849]|nr:hypothetical protein BJ170DRAFT_215460 [Xylariales sp. AK1849]
MAGPASDFSLPNSSFFNIYSDGGPLARSSPAPTLPGGQCNFVDLTHGANGPKCGCRRFWSRSALGLNGSPAGLLEYPNGAAAASQVDQTAFCMCNHHACFHDDTQNGQGPLVAPMVTTAGQENERPRANREPLTPVIPELSFQMPPPIGQSLDFHTFNSTSFSANLQEDIHIPQGETKPTHEPSIPDTMSWGDLIQSQPGHQTNVLPPIPSQCLLSSQPSSTTSSARMRYLRPFGGNGLHTLSGVKSKLRDPLLANPEDTRAQDEDPVDHSTAPSVDDLQTVTNTPRSTRRVDLVERKGQPVTTGPSGDAFQELSNTVQGHEQRIDRLETVSFEDDHEDCHEQHDRTDLRVTELEVRMEEVEKALNDSSSVVGTSQTRFRRPGADESAVSVVSVSTNASGRADRAELFSELQLIKTQLSHLQTSSFPCYTHPWEVEVVFLPFPLKGVWYESRDFPSQRLSGSTNVDADQWTQLPNSSSVMEPQSPGFSEWVGPEMESEWLLPRACAPDKMVEKRLRSRGLIKNVTVRGPDARSVQRAVSEAFGTLFRTLSRMQANVYHGATMHHRVTQFLGLREPWVPLRKIHKDSRLRFLSPGEMITPATWDVPFLSSSVVMKATGANRLFITQPEAYLQDQDAYDNGWNWQRLRELSRVYPDSQTSQQDVPEADAMEVCWAWNDKLDEHDSSQNSSVSLSLRQAAQPRLKSMTPSQQQFFMSRTGRSPSLSNSRSRAASPLIVLKERKASASRPPHIRTTSMPPTIPLVSPTQTKRRIASATFGNIHPHPYDRRPSPQLLRAITGTSHPSLMAKRRRNTRSPSAPISARFRHTPRWSTSSPSPLPEPFAIVGPPASNAGAACRQITPFYYATPYSNAPFVETRPNRGVGMDPDNDEDHGSGTDYLYEDGGDPRGSEDGDSEDHDGDSPMLDLGHPRRRVHDSGDEIEHEDWHGAQRNANTLPEDEPWPGIEDGENRDPEALAFDSEVVDVYVDQDAMSDMLDVDASIGGGDAPLDEAHGLGEGQSQSSSVPSEYPSTQRAWTDGKEEFRVFEDGDGIH